jgi:hypothetical protein
MESRTSGTSSPSLKQAPRRGLWERPSGAATGTVGSTCGAHIARSIFSVSRWAPLLLAAVLAACNNGNGGSGY